MPIIHAEIWKGRSQETRKKLAAALTATVAEHIGCPPQAVTVIIDEIPKESWFQGGKDCEELFPGVG
jgi:4-oxalocrotonate tautomerase